MAEVSPIEEISSKAINRANELFDEATHLCAIARLIKPGVRWCSVNDVNLVVGGIYAVRRVWFNGEFGQPGLCMWTEMGWVDQYLNPLSGSGRSVDVWS